MRLNQVRVFEFQEMKISWFILCVAISAASCATQSPGTPQDSTGAAFQAAQDSTDALADFIRSHPGRPGLSGEAQLRIGYLLAHRGDLPAAIEAYEVAISDYSDVLAPLRNAKVSVADIARLHIASCYKKMGKDKEALAAYDAIADDCLKAANRRHFITGPDEQRIEQPVDGDGQPTPQP